MDQKVTNFFVHLASKAKMQLMIFSRNYSDALCYQHKFQVLFSDGFVKVHRWIRCLGMKEKQEWNGLCAHTCSTLDRGITVNPL